MRVFSPAWAGLVLGAASAVPAEPFARRGCYFILSRNPSYGLDDYRLILDRLAKDRVNLLILWIGGGFPSRRYPETWDYNREHRNQKGIRESMGRPAGLSAVCPIITMVPGIAEGRK